MRFGSRSLARLASVALASLALFAVGSSARAATTIDFEGTGAPDRFEDTTPLTDRYIDLGVRFGGGPGSDPGSILNVASSFQIGARSGTDFLGFNAIITDRQDIFVVRPPAFSERISFNSAAMNFSLWVGSGPAATYTAAFFDGANNLLETRVLNLAPQTYGELVRANPFASVIVSSTSSFWVADDLSFDLIPAVPEPATWLTMLLGFGIVGGALRSRRKAAALQA